MRRIIPSLLGMCLLAAAPARADIKTYNAAVAKGDYAAAAAEAGAIWAGYDKTAAEAPDVAREFAYIALRAKAPGSAEPFLSYLEGPAKTADKMPINSALLRAWSDLEVLGRAQERAAVLDVLKQREQLTGVDVVSLNAGRRLYGAAIRSGDWQMANTAANLAMRMAQRGGLATQADMYHALVAGTVADFLRTQDVKYFHDLEALDILVRNARNAAPADRRNAMSRVSELSALWASAIEAWYYASGSPVPSAKTLPVAAPYTPDLSPDGRPYCSYEIARAPERESMRLPEPSKVRAQSYIGSIRVHGRIDAEGRLRDARVTAIVASERNVDAVLKDYSMMRYKKSPEAPADCVLQRDDYTFVLTYQQPNPQAQTALGKSKLLAQFALGFEE